MTKDELIEKYRYWNVEGVEWWDCTYSDFIERMKDIGIAVDRIYFSGFWSQGDGACFEGSVSDWDLFLRSLGYTDKVLVQHAMEHWSFGVSHYGFYYNANCTICSGELPMPDGYDTEEFIDYFSPYTEDFRSRAWVSALSGFTTDFEQEFTDAFKDHMQQLYKDLEAEYDYLTSDRAVWEALEANEMTGELEDSCE